LLKKIKNILTPKNTINILIFILFFIYTLAPIIFYIIGKDDNYLIELSFISFIAIVSIKAGDILFKIVNPKHKIFTKNHFYVKDKIFAFFNIYVFIFILLLLIIRADSVPLISALEGADAETLSLVRGLFMKPKDEFNYFLIYLFSMQISSIIPYSIAYLYESKNYFRHAMFLIGLLASLSTLVKGMFFNILIPIFSLKLTSNYNIFNFIKYIIIILTTLIFMVSIAGFNKADLDEDSDIDTYISVGYPSKNSFDFMLWRIVVIPILASRDTLEVHNIYYSSNNLMGVTSGLGSKLLGENKIDIEREVFGYQYGGMNDIGNTNSVFFIDAYINFGYIGIVIYGLLASILLRILMDSNIKSVISMAPLFAIFLFSSSLVGILISNGFLFLFAWLGVRKAF
jgi:oligosaccharide repeat unit polymerase